MANWNSGYYFNKTTKERGFMWNGAGDVFLVNLIETFRLVDNILPTLARLVLTEKANVRDTIVEFAFYEYTDSFFAKDGMEFSAFFDLMEKFGMSEKISELTVIAYLQENFALIEKIKELAEFTLTDSFAIEEKTSLFAFFDIMERFGIKDKLFELTVMAYLQENLTIVDEIKQLAEVVISDSFTTKDDFDVKAFMSLIDSMSLTELEPYMESFLKLNDKMYVTDKTPQKSETDFLIGEVSGRDNAYDWFLPFGMKVDWGKSTIQVMPEAELTSIEMPGIDGSIIENTVYKDRLFQIVAYSEQGMTQQEKEDLKREITKVLDRTKKESRKLTVQSREVTFDIKYDGAANITEGPSYVRLAAPFRTPPYGYDMFDNVLEGSGLIENKGAAPVGVIHAITGPLSSPTFVLGDVEYKYSGDIESGSQLIINHETYTCYIKDGFGDKTNALANLSGEFQKIPKGQSVVLTVDDDLKSKFKTTWVTKRLW